MRELSPGESPLDPLNLLSEEILPSFSRACPFASAVPSSKHDTRPFRFPTARRIPSPSLQLGDDPLPTDNLPVPEHSPPDPVFRYPPFARWTVLLFENPKSSQRNDTPTKFLPHLPWSRSVDSISLLFVRDPVPYLRPPSTSSD